MNERIRLLAEQAGLEFDDDLALESEPIYYTTQKDLEKFTELIVQECVEICRSEDWEDRQGWGKLYAHKIKKHFEIK